MIRDSLTTAVQTWNSRNPIESIDLRNKEQCALAAWDVTEQPLLLPNSKIKTGLSMLVCTDDGLPLGSEEEELNRHGVPTGRTLYRGRLAFNPGTYKVFSNDEMLSIVELICAELDKLGVKYRIATTGSVDNRNKTFVAVQIIENEKFSIDGREFLNFLDVLNSFNKSCNITFVNSSICVCCANTFRMALHDDKGAFKISIPHKKNMRNAIAEVPALIHAAFTTQADFAKQLKAWYEFGLNATDAEQVFAAYIGRDAKTGEYNERAELSTRAANTVDKLATLFVKGKGNKGQTALDLFQAATEYYTHFSAGESKDASKQFESSEFGSGADNKTEFFSALVGATNSVEKFRGVARIGEKILVAYRAAKK